MLKLNLFIYVKHMNKYNFHTAKRYVKRFFIENICYISDTRKE